MERDTAISDQEREECLHRAYRFLLSLAATDDTDGDQPGKPVPEETHVIAQTIKGRKDDDKAA